MLLERDAELDAVQLRLASAAEGHGSVVVVEGPPGIGKTALLREIAELATKAGFEVLGARGSELERAFSFGLARQLLERRLHRAPSAERAAVLAGAAKDSLQALGALDAAAESDAGLRGLHALYWLVANLAGRQPLVLCVDDAHWADSPSLRWLVYTAERLAGVPLLMVVATRLAEPGADQDLLDSLALGERAAVLHPAELSGPAVEALIGAALGADPAPEFGAACRLACAGNPLLLHALLSELASSGVAPTAANADQLLEFGADAVARIVRRRLRAVGPAVVAVAECLAILGDGASLSHAARLAGLASDQLRDAVTVLIAIDVLARDTPASFVHPLVRAAVYSSMSPVARADLHGRAARDLHDQGATADRLALHLLRVEPAADPWVADVLCAAGRGAAENGAPAIAARFLRRALAELPSAGPRRAEVLRDLGVSEADAGQPDFEEHLRAAITESEDPIAAGECALALAYSLVGAFAHEHALVVLEHALERVPADAPLAIRLEEAMLGIALADVPLRAHANRHFERRLAQFDVGETLDPGLLASLAGWLIDQPPASRAAAVARTALAARSFPGGSSVIFTHAAHALLAGGDYAGATQALAELEEFGRRQGSGSILGWADVLRAMVGYSTGDIVAAECAARAIVKSTGPGSTFGTSLGRSWALGIGAPPLIARGFLADAEELLARAPEPLRPRSHMTQLLLTARADLRLAQGRNADAIGDLRAAGAVFEPGEFPNPFHSRHWRGHLALALVAVGERDEARDLATAELADARRFGVPATIGISLAACGVAEGGPTGAALLVDAVETLAGTQARLEHARALVHLGTVLRESGSREAAREPLREGMDLAARCGATVVADRAHTELVAAGARPRRERRLVSGPESLTGGEHRVATLASQGLTDRQVAEQLYVTQAAVQWHLRNTFRKLAITSRGQLAAALEIEAGGSANP